MFMYEYGRVGDLSSHYTSRYKLSAAIQVRNYIRNLRSAFNNTTLYAASRGYFLREPTVISLCCNYVSVPLET